MAFNFLNPSLPMPGPRTPAPSPRMPVMPTPPQPVMPVMPTPPQPVMPVMPVPPEGQPIMPPPSPRMPVMPELPIPREPQPEIDIEVQIKMLQAERDQLKVQIETINNQIRELMMKQPSQPFLGNLGLGNAGLGRGNAGRGIMDLLKGRGRGDFNG